MNTKVEEPGDTQVQNCHLETLSREGASPQEAFRRAFEKLERIASLSDVRLLGEMNMPGRSGDVLQKALQTTDKTHALLQILLYVFTQHLLQLFS